MYVSPSAISLKTNHSADAGVISRRKPPPLFFPREQREEDRASFCCGCSLWSLSGQHHAGFNASEFLLGESLNTIMPVSFSLPDKLCSTLTAAWAPRLSSPYYLPRITARFSRQTATCAGAISCLLCFFASRLHWGLRTQQTDISQRWALLCFAVARQHSFPAHTTHFSHVTFARGLSASEHGV